MLGEDMEKKENNLKYDNSGQKKIKKQLDGGSNDEGY